MLKTAVVILNWNGKRHMEEFLGKVIRNTEKEGTRVIVADNGSTDGSVEWLKAEHPETRLILLDRNYGFTGGYNRALDQIDAEYYLLLNSDVETGKGWLEPMQEFMDTHPECAAAMPKVKSYHEKGRFEYAGASGGYIDMFGYPFCRGRILSRIENDNGQYDDIAEVFWASGVSLMVRADAYRQAGGLDEIFFAHMEEIDLCWRLKHLGYKIMAVPQSVIYHVGGGTLPNNSPQKLYLNYRNNLLMMYKNMPRAERHILLLIRKILDGASAAVYLLQGKVSFFKAVFRAHRDYYKLKHKVVRFDRQTSRYNRHGIYRGSIVLQFFLHKGKFEFSKIRHFRNTAKR